ncbi:MAG: hypothetical protein U0X73_05335 [Thermoanaerobaculia bacterium]
MSIVSSLLLATALVAATPATAPPAATSAATMDPANCPMHAQHMAAARAEASPGAATHEMTIDPGHAAAVDARGDRVMGFGHGVTSHHFLLLADGGAIAAEALDPADTTSRDAIRRHFADIAAAFAHGDFSAPLAIHGVQPPGVETLRLVADRVTYAVEPTPAGGRVRISTADPVALAAVHDFLRFQIAEHRTGDPVAVAP